MALSPTYALDTQADIPRITAAWERELAQGESALSDMDYATASIYLAKAFARNPDHPQICAVFGRIKMMLGEVEDAEALLRRGWRKAPANRQAASDLACLLGTVLGRTKEALRVIEEATSVQGRSTGLEVLRAELLLDENCDAQARLAAQAALRCAKTTDDTQNANRAMARVVNQEGITVSEYGHYDRALFLFHQAAKLDPSWSCPHVNMGAAFAGLDKYIPAKRCYEKALLLDPHNPTAHYNLGLWLREHGDTTLAVSEFEQAVAGDPDNADAWVQLGICLAIRDVAKAEECWRTAISLDPKHSDARHHIADLLTREARFSEAVQFLRHVDPAG